MNLFTQSFITLLGIYACNAGYYHVGQHQKYSEDTSTTTEYAVTNIDGGVLLWFPGLNSETKSQTQRSNLDEPYTPICDVKCKNNGICVERNKCRCPPEFEGKYCEVNRFCKGHPPKTYNAKIVCYMDLIYGYERCTITCLEGFKYSDGSTVANVSCVSGKLVPAPVLSKGCLPHCDPPCLNGGNCVKPNYCFCPIDYRGPQCQYSEKACDDKKLGFNGWRACEKKSWNNDKDGVTCYLMCHYGFSFSTPPAESYTCLYSTGVFEPQPIPQCVLGEKMTSSSYTSEATSLNNTTSKPFNEDDILLNSTSKGGRCVTWSGKHYKTFDGVIYSFQSSCTHVLLRDAVEQKYTVGIQQPACSQRDHCPAKLYVYMEDMLYVLKVAENGSVMLENTKQLISIPATLPGIRVFMEADNVVVNLDALGLTLNWDTANMVSVDGSVLLWNKTEGLCGTLDGSADNDLRVKAGFVTNSSSTMAASWELEKLEDGATDVCDGPPIETSTCVSLDDKDTTRASLFCNDLFNKEKFQKCSQVMNISQLLEACQWDYCACAASLRSEECACNTVSVYAKECFRHGVQEIQSWRDADTCPMNCSDGKVYRSCGPPWQPNCTLPEATPIVNSPCVEGCFCPDGLLLESGRCVQRSECPCRTRNKLFPSGSNIRKGCNNCTCQAAEWTCTQVPCGARCSIVGDSHYTTFDGLRYDFTGHCTYTLLKTDNITIEVENIDCSAMESSRGEVEPSCTKVFNLIYKNVIIHLKQGGLILVNGKAVASLPATFRDIRIRAVSSLFIIVQLPLTVDVWWDGNTTVYVDVPPALQHKTEGMCGTFNLNQTDDILTHETDVGQAVPPFSNKWKTHNFCSDITTAKTEHPCNISKENNEIAERYCSKLKSQVFESCHWQVDVQPFYEACLHDMCACAGDAARCLCPILSDYAMECAQDGVVVQWRSNVSECEIQCTGGQAYTLCADSCTRTCADVALAAADECVPRCVEGCACPSEQLLDDKNVCVPVELCPCHYNGVQFEPGYKKLKPSGREQEICECKSGKWSCVGECTVWGDSHVTTFDGAEYDYEGVCRYLLAKGAASDRDGFSVEIQNEPCGTTGATCSKSVTLKVGSGADEESVSLTKSVPLPDVSNLKRIKLRLGGSYVYLDVLSLNMSLQWDRDKRVYMRVNSLWKGKMKGLCGNYNLDMLDDFQSPTGDQFTDKSAILFVDSWKLMPTCPKSQEVPDHCQQRPHRKEWSTATCGAMNRYPFTLCHTVVPPGLFISRCENDACACDSGGDCECTCTALAAYAHACAARGITFEWRTNEICPMQCDSACSAYSACVSPCPPETCDNTLKYTIVSDICKRETCVEGCKLHNICPEGSVYYNSSLTECVQREKCHPDAAHGHTAGRPNN